jgi:hypothetical protein
MEPHPHKYAKVSYADCENIFWHNKNKVYDES